MKNKRHAAILELIRHFDITTQEEMLSQLRESGFAVTQATISRDIKELRLVKTVLENGQYKYGEPKSDGEETVLKHIALLADAVVSVEYAVNMLVIKCSSGMAQAVCATLDSMKFDGILGTLAGEDTIFIVCSNEEKAKELKITVNKLRNNYA